MTGYAAEPLGIWNQKFQTTHQGEQNMLGEKVGSLQASAAVKPLSAKISRPVFEVTANGAGTLGSGAVNCHGL